MLLGGHLTDHLSIIKQTGIIPSFLLHVANHVQQEWSSFHAILHFYTFGRVASGGREGDTRIQESGCRRWALGWVDWEVVTGGAGGSA